MGLLWTWMLILVGFPLVCVITTATAVWAVERWKLGRDRKRRVERAAPDTHRTLAQVREKCGQIGVELATTQIMAETRLREAEALREIREAAPIMKRTNKPILIGSGVRRRS
jgi:hypothetical protein